MTKINMTFSEEELAEIIQEANEEKSAQLNLRIFMINFW